MNWLPTVYEANIPFGDADGKPLVLDIVRPRISSQMPIPAIVHIHGGGWRGGRKSPHWNRFLAQHGFFTISISYRLSHEALFPACVYDCKAAIRWLRAHADDYHLDAERIGVWGHSAGAHLAALLATTGDHPSLEGRCGSPGYSSRVQAAAVVSVPADFLLPDGGLINNPLVVKLFGGTVEQCAEAMRLGSPISHIHSTVPPFLIVHGDRDEIIPICQAQRLYEALSQAGCNAKFVPLAGKGHHLMMFMPTLNSVSRMILAFFDRHLRNASTEMA